MSLDKDIILSDDLIINTIKQITRRSTEEEDAVISKATEKLEEIHKSARELINSILKNNKKTRCPKCDGYGKIERLDSGYMRQFGLREWNGCTNCGGDINKEGKGFI